MCHGQRLDYINTFNCRYINIHYETQQFASLHSDCYQLPNHKSHTHIPYVQFSGLVQFLLHVSIPFLLVQDGSSSIMLNYLHVCCFNPFHMNQLSCQLSYRKCVGILDLSISLVLLYNSPFFVVDVYVFLCVQKIVKRCLVPSLLLVGQKNIKNPLFLLSSFKDLDGQNYRTMDITIENGQNYSCRQNYRKQKRVNLSSQN